MNNDVLFEISWEAANKVGGIYTVISTKARLMTEKYGEHYILIGPDLLREEENKEFEEDQRLFPEWRAAAAKADLKFRAGRWKVPGNPIILLLDFTPFFKEKDSIFTAFWNEFGLDSIAGRWDYIEAAMFGYAAGKLIHSFHDFFSLQNQIIAHFHEWMTGAGILYLKSKAPYTGTVFTTHATILGRTLAGNGLPLYSMMKDIIPGKYARDFNIRAKYSMEKTCAAHADAFATVSEVTARECQALLNKHPHTVTPNGFNADFVPQGQDYIDGRKAAREKIRHSLKAVLGYELSDNAFLVLNSGRYEFHNKGINVFIDALQRLKEQQMTDTEVVGIIAVPAAHGDVLPEIKQRLSGDFSYPEPALCTHTLFEKEQDPVLQALTEKGFGNEKNSRIKLVFVPVYLQGDDGLFDIPYYQFLLAMDLTVFPSYYEPWGYTPMESVAFGIPTVTTTLAGFGLQVLPAVEKGNRGLRVLQRQEDNYPELVEQTAQSIVHFLHHTGDEAIRSDAMKIAASLEWKELIGHYFEIYNIVSEAVDKRSEGLDEQLFQWQGEKFSNRLISRPKWKKAFVKQTLPTALQPLRELAANLWWTWNSDAAQLFKRINPELWQEKGFNPLALIEALSLKELETLAGNAEFIEALNSLYADFQKYMNEKSSDIIPKTAYFSMEYGLHDTVKIFSGGLGVLAGDYLKEASDQNLNLVGVGLLYRYGYFKQSITLYGDQIAESLPQKFTQLPVKPVYDDEGNWLSVAVGLPGRILKARIWLLPVGRIKLYLLDTDIDENNAEDRKLTAHLYGGGSETRLQQEILLGVGGVRALRMAGEQAVLFHLNEGHAAMAGLERLRILVQEQGLDFHSALEVVRSASLFTTHTPVPAGHDTFEESLIRQYIPHYAERLGISWEEFMALGREDRYNEHEEYSMSILAAKLSQQMNGVSALHGKVSREMFASLFPGYFAEELYIGHVTNGVHWPTWTAKKWQEFYRSHFDPYFDSNQNNFDLWQKAYQTPDHEIWKLRTHLRAKLIDYLKERLAYQLKERKEDPKLLLKQINGLDNNKLTIGFARRFATYKRALLLFTNLERLDKIVNHPDTPVQFIFAGKAHPADKAGQDLIKRIIEISRMPNFAGKVFFVADYDMALARKLVQGVDVWLNNPTRPLEASGTSGEKAIMNGVLNLSVLDGWWAEGYVEGAGWALEEERTFEQQELQDQLDAASIYRLIETEICPAFYRRNAENIPEEWTAMIKKNLAEIAPHFTMNRMVEDYLSLYYKPLANCIIEAQSDDYKIAKEKAQWKAHIIKQWPQLEVLKTSYPSANDKPLKLGEAFRVEVWIKTADVKPDDLKVELLMAKKEGENITGLPLSYPLQLLEARNGIARFAAVITPGRAGVLNFSFRVYPWRDFLAHRQELPLVHWI